MKVLYISGPFGYHNPSMDLLHSTEFNILLASQWAAIAAERGWAPFCPHKNTAGFQHYDHIDPEFWMDVCLEFVRRSDAIFMLPRWEKSPGAIREKKLAEELGIPVLFEIPEVSA